jgi:hypothetical protein
LHVIPYRRTIVSMTPVWPMIERFLTRHGAAVLVAPAESVGSNPREVGTRAVARPDRQLLILRDAIAAAAPSPERAAIVASGTLHG